MAFIDYYQILGLDKKASSDDIKKAYRKLARKFHPDLNPKDNEAHKEFQKINEANEVLSDPEKRKKYDAYGENWQHADQYEQAKQSQSRQQYYSSSNPFSGNGEGDRDFSDFFESMFGGAQQGSSRQQVKFKGADYQAELQIPLREVAKTHQHTLSVNGKNLRITVPAGVADGQVIKLKGHGGPGTNNGPAGDLYITFIILEDPIYKRLNNDLYTNVNIDLYTAVLGGEITVNTLDNKVKVKVPAETQNGTKVRLKNKGLPIYKKENTFGDLFITYTVKIPTGLTEEQKELFRQLSKS